MHIQTREANFTFRLAGFSSCGGCYAHRAAESHAARSNQDHPVEARVEAGPHSPSGFDIRTRTAGLRAQVDYPSQLRWGMRKKGHGPLTCNRRIPDRYCPTYAHSGPSELATSILAPKTRAQGAISRHSSDLGPRTCYRGPRSIGLPPTPHDQGHHHSRLRSG